MSLEQLLFAQQALGFLRGGALAAEHLLPPQDHGRRALTEELDELALESLTGQRRLELRLKVLCLVVPLVPQRLLGTSSEGAVAFQETRVHAFVNMNDVPRNVDHLLILIVVEAAGVDHLRDSHRRRVVHGAGAGSDEHAVTGVAVTVEGATAARFRWGLHENLFIFKLYYEREWIEMNLNPSV